MKNKTKRGIAIWLTAVLTAATLLTLNACSDEPKPIEKEFPSERNAPLNNLFGEGYTATVKGTFTKAEWTDVADKVESAINCGFDDTSGPNKNRFKTVFGREDVTIIVEKASGYANWKTTDDGITLYINIDALDNMQSKFTDVIIAMAGSIPTVAKGMRDASRFTADIIAQVNQSKRNDGRHCIYS